MDDFLKTSKGFETTCKLIETINRSTDDYLFIWNIKEDVRWFFGDIDANYDIRKSGSDTNSTPEMLRIIHPADQAAVLASLNEIAQGKKDIHDMDYRWINRQGQKVWINCHGTVIRDSGNTPHLMIGRVSEEKLRHLFNPLTGLWNKDKLHIDLKAKLETGNGYAMLLDVDGLAAINFTHSREYGDALLKEIAELCESQESVSCAYHVDHNYFALVLDSDSKAQARRVYAFVKEAMQGKCTITAAAVPIDKNLFLDETQLLDSLNMTLKKAKSVSNNRMEFFSLEELSKKVSDIALMEELKQSIENGFEGFELYYQPQVKAGNYEIYGVEALLRYNSPIRGRVLPCELIPVLEQSQLIKEVGIWVLREAAEQCKKWRQFLPELRVSVNFSTMQFEDAQLADMVIQIIREVGLEGKALTIEITESMELHSSDRLVDIIKELRTYDINFAIDDFGTGYANLGYLKQLNVDEIKIDRVFISGIEKDTYNHKLISNVIEFAKANAIRTCCEGVENTQELAILELLLPDVIQGYLFDEPNTAEKIEKTYICSETPEYKERLAFIQKVYDFKEQMGIMYFDPKDILRKNEVGLWMIRIKENGNRYELHVDDTMERLLGTDVKFTPKECYDYWDRNIHPDYLDYARESLVKMICGDKAVQIEYPWLHPIYGDVMVRISGKRANDSDGMVVLEGYCKIITHVDGAV